MKPGDVVRLLGQRVKMSLKGFNRENGHAILQWFDKDELKTWECPKDWLVVHVELEERARRR